MRAKRATVVGSGQRQPAEGKRAKVWRAPAADFPESFVRLQDAVDAACAQHGEWQERVAAGVRAALDFAAADPAAARALTLDARRPDARSGNRQEEVIAHFAALLQRSTPEKRFPISTHEALVESVATVIRAHLLAGEASSLPQRAAELIYLVLVPYAGVDSANSWSDAFANRS